MENAASTGIIKVWVIEIQVVLKPCSCIEEIFLLLDHTSIRMRQGTKPVLVVRLAEMSLPVVECSIGLSRLTAILK
jgi:hypothetical protein